MPLYKNQKTFAIASGGVHFKPEEEKAVKRIIPIKGTINYDNLQVDKEFSFSLKIIGGTSSASATVQLFDNELLYLTYIDGTFEDGEELQDTNSVYIADANGVVDYFLLETDPAPYPKSGLVQYDPITFVGAETKTVTVDKHTLIIEFMRIVDTNVTVFLNSTSNTPGLLLQPGEYQSMDIISLGVDTLYFVSAEAGSMAIRQLHE